MSYLKFRGARCFRYRLICSVLSNKPIEIDRIREAAAGDPDADVESSGLSAAESSFLAMMVKLSSGAQVKVSKHGTKLLFRPGVLMGGKFKHECEGQRGLGYFVEALLAVGPFCRLPLRVQLTGQTNNEADVSIDLFRTVIVPTVAQFGLDDGVVLRIKRRGCAPRGGGVVDFECPTLAALKPLYQSVGREPAARRRKRKAGDDGGRPAGGARSSGAAVRRIRGISFCARMAASTCSRMIESARGVLNPFCADVFIYSDACPTASDGGLSPGFAVCLVAETVNGALLGVEHNGGPGGVLPEDVGRDAARLLLAEVLNGGLIDTNSQSLVLLWMCLCEHNVSRACFGKLSQHSVHLLRHLKDFFGVQFLVEPVRMAGTGEDDGDDDNDNDDDGGGASCVELSCRGVGFAHLGRVVR